MAGNHDHRPSAFPYKTLPSPDSAKAWVTLLFSFAGLILLSSSVVLESIENHRAKKALMLETAEMPGVLSSPKMDHAKQFMI
jgi:hypothetical protein